MNLRPEIQARIDQAIAQAKTNHQAELDQLKAEYDQKLIDLQQQNAAAIAQAVQETEEAAYTAFKSGLESL